MRKGEVRVMLFWWKALWSNPVFVWCVDLGCASSLVMAVWRIWQLNPSPSWWWLAGVWAMSLALFFVCRVVFVPMRAFLSWF